MSLTQDEALEKTVDHIYNIGRLDENGFNDFKTLKKGIMKSLVQWRDTAVNEARVDELLKLDDNNGGVKALDDNYHKYLIKRFEQLQSNITKKGE